MKILEFVHYVMQNVYSVDHQLQTVVPVQLMELLKRFLMEVLVFLCRLAPLVHMEIFQLISVRHAIIAVLCVKGTKIIVLLA